MAKYSLKKNFVLFLLFVYCTSIAYANSGREVVIKSTGHDSLFINNIYIGKTPCKFRLDEGVYTISAKNDVNSILSHKVLIEAGKKKFDIFFKLPLQPKWSPNVTPEQKKAILGILENMAYISELSETSNNKYAKKYIANAHTPFYISRNVISVNEWEVIMGKKHPLRKAIKNKNGNIVMEGAMDEVPVKGLYPNELNAFLSKVKELTGIALSIPCFEQMQLLGPDRDYPKGKSSWTKKDFTYTISKKSEFLERIWSKFSVGPFSLSEVYYCLDYNEYIKEKNDSTAIATYMHGPFQHSVLQNLIYKRMNETEIENTCFRLCFELEDSNPSDITTINLPDGVINNRQYLIVENRTLFNELIKLAISGDAKAMQYVGYYYHNGIGVERDDNKSNEWILKAIKNGNEDALFQLAYFYKYGIAVEQNYFAMKSIYEYLAKKNNMEAVAMLGECYYHGLGVVESQRTAVEFFQKSADAGCSMGEYCMGRYYLDNEHKDISKALDYLLKAIEQEDCPGKAYYELGNIYHDKLVWNDNRLRTEMEDETWLYYMGHTKISSEATIKYANKLNKGIGCNKDKYTSVALLYNYFHNPLGQFNEKGKVAGMIALAYELGEGVPKDKELSDKWYYIAAENGDVYSQFHLGRKDYSEESLYWLTTAAENKYDDAYLLLWKNYYEGRYGERDLETAYYWIKQSEDSLGYLRNMFSHNFREQELCDSIKKANNIKDEEISILSKSTLKWNGCEDYMTTDWESVKKEYGSKTPQCAISVFYAHLMGEFSSFYLPLWLDIINKNVNHNSKLYADMLRLCGHSFFSSTERENQSHQKRNKSLENIFTLGWDDDIRIKCNSDYYKAQRAMKTALSTYERCCGKQSPEYMRALIEYAYIISYPLGRKEIVRGAEENMINHTRHILDNKLKNLSPKEREERWSDLTEEAVTITLKYYKKIRPKLMDEYDLEGLSNSIYNYLYREKEVNVCIKATEEFMALTKGLFERTLNKLGPKEREEFWNEWQTYFTRIIPSIAYHIKDSNKLNGIIYDCALLYKGFLLRYDKNVADKKFVTWKEIKERLKDGEIAVEIIKAYDYTWGEEKYICATINKKCSIPSISFLSTEKAFAKCKSRHYTSTDLYTYLWNKISLLTPQTKKIYFSPDGIFYNIAIENVPYDGTTYVDEHWEMYRLSSTREILTNNMHTPLKNALLIGGLEYGDKVAYSRNNAGELPESKVEINQIKEMLSDTHIPSNVLTGNDGSESKFRKINSYPDLIHFATHGYAWNRDWIRTQKKMRFLSDLKEDNNSMLYSGLLLANANKALNGDATHSFTNDGILSAYEISKLNMSKTRLVVLSACNSGLGEINHEGVWGLQRGFKIAGAQTILMTLWKVDDKATSIFMQEFYKYYTQGYNANKALEKAKRYLIDYKEPLSDFLYIAPYRDPKYWAGFIILDGNKL